MVEWLVRRPSDLTKTLIGKTKGGRRVCLILDAVFATGPVRRRVGSDAGDAGEHDGTAVGKFSDKGKVAVHGLDGFPECGVTDPRRCAKKRRN